MPSIKSQDILKNIEDGGVIFRQPKKNNDSVAGSKSGSELDSESIFKSVPVETTYYCYFGQQDTTDSDGYPVLSNVSEKNEIKVCARIDTGNKTRYSIRVGRDGKLYNPDSPYEVKAYSSRDLEMGLHKKFATVQKKTFDWYKGFLKTKAYKYLREAERSFINER